MSYTYLREGAEAYSAECFAGIHASAPSKSNPTAAKFCSKGSATESCRSSRFGTTCRHLTAGRGGGKSTSSAAASRAEDISSANRKAVGICGERSGLWREMARIVGEVRPEYVFAENSPMLESRGVERVLEDLNALGYDTRRVKLGAENLGKTVRQRLWILGRRSRKQNVAQDAAGSGVERQLRDNHKFRASAFSGVLRASPLAGVCGMGDGVPHRLDRLAAVGNAQIPVVAALAFTVLKEFR